MLKKLIISFCILHYAPLALSMNQPAFTTSTQKLINATLDGNTKMAIEALEQGGDPEALVRQDEYGSTVMHVAAMSGNMPLMQALLDKNARVDIRNTRGHTPLIALMRISTQLTTEQALKMMSLLIDNGANVNANDLRNSTTTALQFACCLLKTELAKGLLDAGAIACYEDNRYEEAPPVFNELLYLMMTAQKVKPLASREKLDNFLDLIELLRCAQSKVHFMSADTDDTPVHLAIDNPHLLSSLLVPLTHSSLKSSAHFAIGDQDRHNAALYHALTLKKLAYNRIYTLLCCLKRMQIDGGVFITRDVKSLLLTKYLPVEFTYAEFNTDCYKGTLATVGSKSDMRLRFLDACLPRLLELASSDRTKNMHKQMMKLLSIKNTSGKTPYIITGEECLKAEENGDYPRTELLHILHPLTWAQVM